MSKNQLMLTPEINEAFKPEVLEVVRNSFAPTATDSEFVLFAHKAASYNLDPFKNEIFFIKYGNTARIQFAAEAYLAKAREMEGFEAPDTQMVHENDEFKIARNPETKELEVVQHDIGFPRGKIIGAYSIAYRKDHRPVTVIMDISEVDHMFTGQNKENWKKWTSDMFGKHVQQRALKKQYGLNFGDDEGTEVQPNNAVPDYKPDRKDITPNADVIDAEPTVKDPKEANPIDDLKKKMKEKFKILGISDKDSIQAYITENAPQIKGEPTMQQLIGLLEIMDMHIDFKAADDAAADSLD